MEGVGGIHFQLLECMVLNLMCKNHMVVVHTYVTVLSMCSSASLTMFLSCCFYNTCVITVCEHLLMITIVLTKGCTAII